MGGSGNFTAGVTKSVSEVCDATLRGRWPFQSPRQVLADSRGTHHVPSLFQETAWPTPPPSVGSCYVRACSCPFPAGWTFQSLESGRGGRGAPLLSRREGTLFGFLVVLRRSFLGHSFRDEQRPRGWAGSKCEVRKHTAAEATSVVSSLCGRTAPVPTPAFRSTIHLTPAGAGHLPQPPCKQQRPPCWALPRARLCHLTESCQPPGGHVHLVSKDVKTQRVQAVSYLCTAGEGGG